MKLVTFIAVSDERIGAIVSGGVLDLCAAGEALDVRVPASMQALIEAGPSVWDAVRGLIDACPRQFVQNEVTLLAPLPRPVRLRDASLFIEHMEAAVAKLGRVMSEEFKKQIIYYNADHVHVFGPNVDIAWPRKSHWIDYELEWACIVGLPGKNLSREDAKQHIFGFTIFNDWSARDLQFSFMGGNLGPGEGKDFANSLGPCIVTTDEFVDPYNLRMTARINGQVWSDGTTRSMHYRFEDALVQFSADRGLVAGEIIGSGTVLGGCGYELDRQLQIGDQVELEIEGIGVLKNRVTESAPIHAAVSL
jgi:2-keto-4-pentenoate hydratase/2-oxohepta-3-ene-1,7-dioic acid hydratase in catechol pathway